MKVHVTGTGLMAPLGAGTVENFKALCDNRSHMRFMHEWDQVKGLGCKVASLVDGLDGSSIPRSKRRTMSKMSIMAVRALDEALQSAGLQAKDLSGRRTLLVVGSTTSSLETLSEAMTDFSQTLSTEGQLSTTMFKVMSHTLALNLSTYLDFRGEVICLSSACSTSAQAILVGLQYLKAGLCDLVIAGGGDEAHVSTCIGFDKAKAASVNFNDQPHRASRPFDKDRTGIVVAEAASILIMEPEELMKARGAKSRGRVLGGAQNCFGENIANSSAESISVNMQQAMRNAGVSTSDICYVNAHATGTVIGDLLEAAAIKSAFPVVSPPVSSLKGHYGHTLAACGALEAIMSLEMIRERTLIGTKNLDEQDPQLPDLLYLGASQPTTGSIFLTNNFAMGGVNVSLVMSVEE